nr:glycosyl hydrolase family protein [Ipomoea batatas]
MNRRGRPLLRTALPLPRFTLLRPLTCYRRREEGRRYRHLLGEERRRESDALLCRCRDALPRPPPSSSKVVAWCLLVDDELLHCGSKKQRGEYVERVSGCPFMMCRWTQDGSLKLRQSGDNDNNNRSAPDFVTPSLEEGEREQREGSRKNVEISIEEARPLDTNAGGNGWKYDLNRIATIPLPWSYAGAKNSGPSPQGSGHVPVPPGKNSGPSPQGSGHVPVPPMKNSGPSPQGSGHVPVPPMKNSGPSPQGSGHVPVPPVEFH